MRVKIKSYRTSNSWEATCEQNYFLCFLNPNVVIGYGIGFTRQEAIADAIQSFKRNYLKKNKLQKEKFKLELEI